MSGPSKRFPLFSRNLSCEGLRSCRSSRPRPRLRRPRRHQTSGSSTSCIHRKTVRLGRRQLLPVLGPDRGSLRTEGPKLGRVQEVKQPLATSTAEKAGLWSQHIIGESIGKLRDQRGPHRSAAAARSKRPGAICARRKWPHTAMPPASVMSTATAWSWRKKALFGTEPPEPFVRSDTA